MARKSAKTRKTRPGTQPLPAAEKRRNPGDVPPLAEIFTLLRQNRPGIVGFSLSLLQLPAHSTWILLLWYLQTTGAAKNLTSDSWISWIVVGILGFSMLLTFSSLFVCLVFGLRRSPRTLAVVGFFLSFFVGSLATAVVFMSAIRSMGG